MALFDMFDKIDDMVYKPIEMICDWCKEPLRYFDDNRKKKDEELKRKHEERMARLKVELEDIERKSITEDEKKKAETDLYIQRCQEEINVMIKENEDKRRDHLVESLKNYQITMAKTTVEIQNTIGNMSIELRKKANDMILEYTKKFDDYSRLVRKESSKEIQEYREDFADDEETFKEMKSCTIDNMRTLVASCGQFITFITEDVKRLNETIDATVTNSMSSTKMFIDTLTQKTLGEGNLLSDR